MATSIGNNLSALRAFGQQTAVTANNVANAQTEGFKSTRADMNEGDDGGVRVTLSTDESPGPLVSETTDTGSVELKEQSNVDFATEMTGMIPTQRGYEANLKAVQAQDDMLGTVIDMKV